jgi:hypothetical protein
LNEKLDLIAEGFGLTRDQRRLLIRIAWVLGVSGHIAWVCGFLSIIGLASPFARADRVEKLERSAQISARISLAQEYRVQVRAYCVVDERYKEGVLIIIERIRSDYTEITNGQTLPEPRCP